MKRIDIGLWQNEHFAKKKQLLAMVQYFRRNEKARKVQLIAQYLKKVSMTDKDAIARWNLYLEAKSMVNEHEQNLKNVRSIVGSKITEEDYKKFKKTERAKKLKAINLVTRYERENSKTLDVVFTRDKVVRAFGFDLFSAEYSEMIQALEGMNKPQMNEVRNKAKE